MALVTEQVLHQRELDSEKFESDQDIDSAMSIPLDLEGLFSLPAQTQPSLRWRVQRFVLFRMMSPELAHKSSLMALRLLGWSRGFFRSLRSG